MKYEDIIDMINSLEDSTSIDEIVEVEDIINGLDNKEEKEVLVCLLDEKKNLILSKLEENAQSENISKEKEVKVEELKKKVPNKSNNIKVKVIAGALVLALAITGVTLIKHNNSKDNINNDNINNDNDITMDDASNVNNNDSVLDNLGKTKDIKAYIPYTDLTYINDMFDYVWDNDIDGVDRVKFESNYFTEKADYLVNNVNVGVVPTRQDMLDKYGADIDYQYAIHNVECFIDWDTHNYKGKYNKAQSQMRFYSKDGELLKNVIAYSASTDEELDYIYNQESNQGTSKYHTFDSEGYGVYVNYDESIDYTFEEALLEIASTYESEVRYTSTTVYDKEKDKSFDLYQVIDDSIYIDQDDIQSKLNNK